MTHYGTAHCALRASPVRKQQGEMEERYLTSLVFIFIFKVSVLPEYL